MGIGDFFDDIWDKTKEQGKAAAKTVATPLTLPMGVVWDLARITPWVDKNTGPDWLGTKNALSGVADTLIGQGTLTGWTISTAGQGLNTAYRQGIENPIEAAAYVGDQLVMGDPVSWSSAWDLAKQRNIGQTAQLIGNDYSQKVTSLTGAPDALPNVLRALPGGTVLGEAYSRSGVGDEKQKDVRATDTDAWHEFQKVSPFWSGMTATGTDVAAQFVADPFILGGKVTKPLRELRNARPIRAGEEVGLAERMASEDSLSFFGIHSRKAGLKSRTDPLIGTVKYVEKTEDGKPVLDEDGVQALAAAQDKAGFLDDKSPVQLYNALGLKSHPYGDQIATLLSRTNKITDPAAKVNVRRDILASMGGDAAANARLSNQAEGKEFAYALSNAFQGKGTGDIITAFADDANAAAIRAGEATHAYADPNVVAGVQDELNASEDFREWLYASMKDRTFMVTPKSHRALARLAGQGIGRDGTVHTGRAGLDRVVNDKILGKFKSDGSVVDNAIANSDELVGTPPRPGSLADGKVYTPDVQAFHTSPNSMPAYITGPLKVAGWATGVTPAAKLAAKTSDALRGRVVQGALNLEDSNLTIAVTQDFMRRAGVPAERADKFVSSVVAAQSPTARAIAVQKAQDEAISVIANRHGVDTDTIKAISVEHGRRREATLAAKRGQSYSAHTKNGPDGDVVRGDVTFLPDDAGTVVSPILDTQTINYMPLMDLDYVDKWLKRDDLLRAASRLRKTAKEPNPLAVRATELGFNSKITSGLKAADDVLVRSMAERTNAFWKRWILLSRAPSFAIRNTIEEQMRTWAIGRGAVVADNAARLGVQDARDFARRKGLGPTGWQEHAPAFAKLQIHKAELEDLRSIHDDPDILGNVKAIRTELRSLKAKRAHAVRNGDTTKQAELSSAIDHMESMPQLTDYAEYADDIANTERTIAALTKQLEERVLPDSGMQRLEGHGDLLFPQAHEGVEGKSYYDLVDGNGQFDNDVTGFADRTFAKHRGTGEAPTISVSSPYVEQDVIDRHAQAWAWIVNKQIGQDEAARIALKAQAEGVDGVEVTSRVQRFLESPAGAKYRKGNPARAHDTEAWAGDIADMTKHYVPTPNFSQRVLDGEVDKAEMVDDFAREVRPDVHPAGVDSLVGSSGRKEGIRTHRWFRTIDQMSTQRMTRHPMFTAYFQEEQTRLADDFLRKAVYENGEDATLTVDDINTLSSRARKTAAAKLKRTFYDTHSRSSAAQQLRFMYPFFAAHQDSMTFWGRAIAADPTVLRKLQLGFQTPASLGLVVDRDGNPVKPGEFIENDHMVLIQMPKAWGGPDPQDPKSRQGGFRLPLSAANLITQNGSILNPGAGPLAAIPAGYVARKWGATDDDLSKALTWFNPFGAPKTGDNPALPEALQGLDPALPTPLRRLASLYDAHTNQSGREYTEMWAMRMTEAQVKFYQEHGRTPNSQESRDLENTVSDEVKHMSLLRFGASLASPIQPQPNSRMQGFINEFRRIQQQGRDEGRGPFWATDQFLDKYGDAYIALTKSASENRAGLYHYSSAEVRSLQAHEKLTERTAPEVWRVIVGAEGEGAFSINAYRWMQNKAVGTVGGEKLVDKKQQYDRMLDVNVAAGWRAYTKAANGLLAVATANGFSSVDQSPELKALRQQINAELAKKFPDWAANRKSSVDFDSELWPSLQFVAKDKRLLNDPARGDIKVLGQYVQGRQAVVSILAQRKAAGGSLEIDAQSNVDVAQAYALFISELTNSNTVFADYAVPGIISRDPLYKSELLEVNGGV